MGQSKEKKRIHRRKTLIVCREQIHNSGANDPGVWLRQAKGECSGLSWTDLYQELHVDFKEQEEWR